MNWSFITQLSIVLLFFSLQLSIVMIGCCYYYFSKKILYIKWPNSSILWHKYVQTDLLFFSLSLSTMTSYISDYGMFILKRESIFDLNNWDVERRSMKCMLIQWSSFQYTRLLFIIYRIITFVSLWMNKQLSCPIFNCWSMMLTSLSLLKIKRQKYICFDIFL
jgi:hypothetical protein